MWIFPLVFVSVKCKYAHLKGDSKLSWERDIVIIKTATFFLLAL